jgi:hypothetical protein
MNKHLPLLIFQLFVLFLVVLSLANVLYRIHLVSKVFMSGTETCYDFNTRNNVEDVIVSEDVSCPNGYVNSFSFYNKQYKPVICCVKMK